MSFNRPIRKFIDLTRQACGKWADWDPPVPVVAGDYGTFNDIGELAVDGNIYDDEFQKYLKDNGFTVDLRAYPPEILEASGDLYVTSYGVRKEQSRAERHDIDRPREISPFLVQGTWNFPTYRRGALVILFAPREVCIPKDALEKLLDERLLEGKYLVTSVLACPAYLKYLSAKSGDSISVTLQIKSTGMGSVSLAGWETNKESDLLRTAFHPNAKYRFTPLYSLKSIGKRPYSPWLKDKGASDFTWLDVYPTWKPLDDDGAEIDD